MVILVDDLGWNDVGFHGGQALTPRIDELRGQGREETCFYAFPTCSPSRAALLTGEVPMDLDMVRGPVNPWNLRELPAGQRTLPETLSELGYQCFLLGKWHLGIARRESWPDRRGFHHFYGLLGGAADYFDRRRHGGLDWQRDGVSLEEQGYTTDLLADEAVRVLEEHDRRIPLFLMLSLTAPHVPLAAPAELDAGLEGITDPDRRKFLAVVAGLDRATGRVLDALESSGLAEDTLVVFVSDNGAEPGHGGSNLPFRGGKATTFEGGLRVPLILRWPGRIDPASTSDRPVWMPDLFATLATAAGATVPMGASGQDLLAQSPEGEAREFFFSHQSGSASWLGTVQGKWKGVWHRDWAEDKEDFWLFDLEEDPTEKNDLAQLRPAVARRIREAMIEWGDGSGLLMPPGPSPQPSNWSPPGDWADLAR